MSGRPARPSITYTAPRALRRAAAAGAGIVLPAMEKSALFPYVTAHGILPRKTFSMGEAEEKRYYLEAAAL